MSVTRFMAILFCVYTEIEHTSADLIKNVVYVLTRRKDRTTHIFEGRGGGGWCLLICLEKE